MKKKQLWWIRTECTELTYHLKWIKQANKRNMLLEKIVAYFFTQKWTYSLMKVALLNVNINLSLLEVMNKAIKEKLV